MANLGFSEENDFERQIDHRIPVRRPDLMLINRKKEIIISLILPFQQSTKWK